MRKKCLKGYEKEETRYINEKRKKKEAKEIGGMGKRVHT